MFFLAHGPCYVCGKELGLGEGKVVFVEDGCFLPALEDFCDECIEREKRCEQCNRFLTKDRIYCSICDQDKIEEQIEKDKAEEAEYAREESERVRQEYLDTLINTCEQCGDKHNCNSTLCDSCGRKFIKGEL